MSSLGIDKSNKSLFFIKKYSINTIIVCLLSLIFFFIVTYVLNALSISYIVMTIKVGIGIISLSLLVELLIPIIMKKVMK